MLQEYPFHVFDFSGYQGNAAASVFDPALGFSGCTTPEWEATMHSVKAGNALFPRSVIKGGTISPVTLSRGVRWYDSDFYNWLIRALKGIAPVRRDLFLVQFMGFRQTAKQTQSAAIKRKVYPSGFADVDSRKVGGLKSLPPENGLNVLMSRIPARCWYMRKCLPSGYKPGGDFEANSANVSIATLTLQPTTVDEVTTATISNQAARAFSTSLAIADLARL